ncbi:hypothetical protein FGRMN_995 [Fusarium graminum]|nr:hypothetical protein FGRMN_995 [Fusarium graminum]
MKLSRVTPCMLLAAGCHAAYVQFIDCSDGANASTLIPDSFRAAVVPGRHAFDWRFDVVVGQLGRNACEIDSADIIPDFAVLDYNHDLEHVSGQVVNRSCHTTDRRGSRARLTIASTFNRSSLLDTFRTTLELTSQDHTTLSCVKAVLTPAAPKTIRLLSLWLPITTFILTCIAACWPVQQSQSTHFKNTRIARPIDLLAYIQFIFFSGSFSLQYPGFFQPLVGLCSWSTLMLPAGVVEATSPYPRAGVQDGIYEHNGTITGAPGLELLTQMTGSPVKRQSWMNTLVLSLFVFFFLYIATYIRCRPRNASKGSDSRFGGLQSQLKNQYWTVIRLFLSCFMLPLSAWSTYQFHQGYVFGYQTSIMAMLVLILLLASFWWSWSQDSDMGSLIVQNPDALEVHQKSTRRYHALVLFSLMLLRGSVIGGLQTYTAVQIGILLGCEVTQLMSMTYWTGLPSFISLAGILPVSRLALFSLNIGFLPGIAGHSGRMLVAYIILCGHLMVLFCIFLLPTVFNLVMLAHRSCQAKTTGIDEDVLLLTKFFQCFWPSLAEHQKTEMSLPLDIEAATKYSPHDRLDPKSLLLKMIMKREASFFSQEKADIASKDLSEFFADVQGESKGIISKDAAIFSDSSSTLVASKESRLDIRPTTELSLDDLAAHLLSAENLAIRDELLNHDLDRPINEYFISSSHNTYLLGRQVATRSKLAGYVETLSQGCRSVEIDCWDGRDGRPIVKHGYSLTKSISFRSVVATINEYAFTASDLPLWLSLEVHCSPSQRDIMAGIMVEVFSASLLKEPLEGSMQTLPSPNQMRGKILLKVKFAPTQDVQQTNQDLLQSLAVYGAGKRLPRHGEFNTTRNFIYSVSETNLKKHVNSKQPLGSTDMNHMVRVYPDPNRLDSSNFDPLECWKHGVQMVALNYQTDDPHTSLNQALFHGSSGYVLKAQPEAKNFHLQVDVLLAHGIQELSTMGPAYVEIELLAPDVLSPRVRTASAPRLKQHICYDQTLTVSIETKYSNLTFLRWAVKTAPGVPVSSGLARVDNLKKGYRILPLRNPSRSNIDNGQLLCKISLEAI